QSWKPIGGTQCHVCDGSASTPMPGLGITLEDQRRTRGRQSVNRPENKPAVFRVQLHRLGQAPRGTVAGTVAGDRPDVFTYSEDYNTVLLQDVFPRAKHADYRRALCLLTHTTLT